MSKNFPQRKKVNGLLTQIENKGRSVSNDMATLSEITMRLMPEQAGLSMEDLVLMDKWSDDIEFCARRIASIAYSMRRIFEPDK